MSLLIARKKSEEETPLFDYRRFFHSYRLNMPPQVIPAFRKPEIYICPISHFEPFGRPRGVRVHRRFALDDSESRNAIWKALFEDEPLPTIEEGAVQKYAGSLDKYLPENIPVDKFTKRSKKG